MTFLELVNNVLRRLREPTVTSVNDTPYAAMVGVFVNDAKREVEDSADWNSLSSTITVTTVSGTYNYTLTGSGTRFRVVDVLNDSSNVEVRQAPTTWLNKQFLLSTTAASTPMYYGFNGVDTNGDTQVDLFPVPNAAYTVRFNVIVPQEDLVNDSDRVQVLGHLVAMLAYAKAIAERGEDGGNLSSEAYALFKSALSNAIAIERNRFETDMNWVAP